MTRPRFRSGNTSTLRIGSALALLSVLSACDSSPPPPPPTSSRPLVEVEPTTTVPTDDPEQAAANRAEEAATRLAHLYGQTYSEARRRLTPNVAIRYFGDTIYAPIELLAALPENDPGFPNVQYKLDCRATPSSTLCSLAHAFPLAAIKEAVGMFDALGVQFSELGAVGSVRGSWPAKAPAVTYGGECGSIECEVSERKVQIKPGIAVNSVETLACLRALCVLAESGLRDSGLPVRVRGMVGSDAARTAGERTELRVAVKTAFPQYRTFWRDFASALGH